MVTSVDTFGIKERIVAIIKDDTTNLFSATPSDDTKFRIVEAGAPEQDKARRGPFPRLWVTNQISVVDEVRRIGSQSTASSKTSPKMTQHTLHLEIVFFVAKKDSPKSEEQADDFVKLLLEKLKSDTKLSDPDTPGTDAKADDVIVDRVIPYDIKGRGKPVSGRRILFRVITTTGE